MVGRRPLRPQKKKDPPPEEPMMESSITTPQAGHPEPEPQPDPQPELQTEPEPTVPVVPQNTLLMYQALHQIKPSLQG